MELLKSKDPRGVPEADIVLRDTFIENVRDEMLQRELVGLLRQHSNYSFKQIRQAAVKWSKRYARPTAHRPRAYSCDSYASAIEEEGAECNAIAIKPPSELEELKECFRKQQAQLDTIIRQLGNMPPSVSGQRVNPTPRPQQYRFQPNGRPICQHCNKAGHIARFCRATRREEESGVPVRNQGNQLDGNVNAIEMQEN